MATISSRDVNDLLSLRGKVALMTGVTGHLGSSMAEALAEAGASVVVSSRDLGRARDAASRLPRVGDARHLPLAMDHMDESSIEGGFGLAERQTGRIDVLVNNGHEPLGADWTTVTGEQFRRQLANAAGYFLLARRFREHAVSRGGGGSVVMIGSMYGLVASYPDAYEGVAAANPVAYQTLKGGILQMTRHLAVYWARDGVRVNCLSPGPFPAESASPEMVERLKGKSPMGRMGRPDELKGAIVFLASDASSYMTGQNLVVDGGWTAW
jgi:NAD(P)-dependent dehydrogenase (short-subunit alcohol dehydrogenase family)